MICEGGVNPVPIVYDLPCFLFRHADPAQHIRSKRFLLFFDALSIRREAFVFRGVSQEQIRRCKVHLIEGRILHVTGQFKRHERRRVLRKIPVIYVGRQKALQILHGLYFEQGIHCRPDRFKPGLISALKVQVLMIIVLDQLRVVPLRSAQIPERFISQEFEAPLFHQIRSLRPGRSPRSAGIKLCVPQPVVVHRQIEIIPDVRCHVIRDNSLNV